MPTKLPRLSTNLSIRILSIMNFSIIFANANGAKVVDTVQFQQKGSRRVVQALMKPGFENIQCFISN